MNLVEAVCTALLWMLRPTRAPAKPSDPPRQTLPDAVFPEEVWTPGPEELRPTRPTPTDHVWAVVANVVDEHPHGEQQEIRRGTKVFRPNSKVYVVGGYLPDTLTVIGQPRKQRRWVTLHMRRDRLVRFRAEKVYRPGAIEAINTHREREWSELGVPPQEHPDYDWHRLRSQTTARMYSR